jgi:hypothetical protein
MDFLFLWLYSPILGLAASMKLFVLFRILDLGPVSWTPWTGDQLIARLLRVYPRWYHSMDSGHFYILGLSVGFHYLHYFCPPLALIIKEFTVYSMQLCSQICMSGGHGFHCWYWVAGDSVTNVTSIVSAWLHYDLFAPCLTPQHGLPSQWYHGI